MNLLGNHDQDAGDRRSVPESTRVLCSQALIGERLKMLL